MSKSKFTRKYVEGLARMIKLELTETEADKFAKEMEETLNYIENLESLDTTSVEPTFQTTGIVNRFQKEAEGERTLDTPAVFQNAPARQENYFKIKGLGYGKWWP